jgi:hypothetical protein
MHIFSAFFLLLLTLDQPAEPLVFEAPDSAFAERLEWAQAELDSVQRCGTGAGCDDVAINGLALISLGRLDLARPSLVMLQPRTPLWVLASYDYWLTSADHAYVREQWPFFANVLFAPADHLFNQDGGVLLAATQAVATLARARDDSTTLSRITAQLSAAEQRAQEQPGIFGPALGLVDADHADARLNLLADTIHTRWPLATGLVSLAMYEYHREAEGFALLRAMAQRETSSAAMFVLPLVRGLIGWEVDAPNRAIAVEPHLPEKWNSVAISNLKVGAQEVDVEVTRDVRSYRVQLTKAGNAPLSIRLSPALPRGARVTAVTVNDADAPIHLEETRHDTHVVIETTLRRELEVEIEYSVPRPRRSP